MEQTFTIGKFKITIAGKGCGKKKNPEDYTFGSKLYRQDCLTVKHCDNVLVVCVADGHGPEPQGSLYSQICSEKMVSTIFENIAYIKMVCLNKEKLHEFMNYLFQEVDNYFLDTHPRTSRQIRGGSTLTINVKMLHPKRSDKLVSFTCNVGDSPMLRISDKKVTQINQDLNSDTLENYQHYIDFCNRTKRTPLPAILGRLNTLNNYPIPWIAPFGVAIEPFKLDFDGKKWNATYNFEILERFHRNATPHYKKYCLDIGGSQSIRSKSAFIKQVQEAEKGETNFPEFNFGNTVDGIQCLPGSCFGDKINKRDRSSMLMNTTLEIWSRGNKKKEIEVLCSDGIFDVLTDEKMIEACEKANYKAGRSCKELYHMSIEEAAIGEFPFLGGLPNWDDLSLMTIKVEYKKKRK